MLLTPFVASADDEATKKFVEAYKKASGSTDDPNQFAADAYDCVIAIAAAIEAAKLDPSAKAADLCEALIKQFTDSSFKVAGLTGEATWSASGEVSKTPKGMVIQKGVYVAME